MHGLPLRRRGWALAVAGGVAALALVVAAASHPDGLTESFVGGGVSRTVLDSLFYLFAALMVLGFLLLVWLIWPQKDDIQPMAVQQRRNPLLAIVLVALMVLALVWWRRAHPGSLGNLPLSVPGAPGLGGAGSSTGRGPSSIGFDWLAAAITLVVLAAAGFAIWRALRRPDSRPRVITSPVPELEQVLDEAVDEAGWDPDPRRAVIAAWSRLERVLTRHGARRRPAEAPFEYAARAAGLAELRREPLEQLAALYEWARFSVHEVTPDMREQALSGLLAVREGLRLAT